MKNWKTLVLFLNNLVWCSNLNISLFINHNFDQRQVSVATYQYSDDEKREMIKESNWCQKYYNNSVINPYRRFLTITRILNHKNASENSKYQFDCLFDNRIAPRLWYTFADLNKILTTTKLSNQVTIKLDWNQLYHKIQLDEAEIARADNYQLRFYNIIAKLYGKKNILRLAQKLIIDDNLTYYTKTEFYPQIKAINFRFNPMVANQEVIDYEYEINCCATRNLIVHTMYQYAQALIYYITNDSIQREQFNQIPIAEEKDLIKDQLPKKNYHNNNIFHDASQNLIDFLLNYLPLSAINNPIKKVLFPLLIVDSRYSRLAWILNEVNARNDFFIEAFVKWLGTEPEQRKYDWEILNTYFMTEFRHHFQIQD